MLEDSLFASRSSAGSKKPATLVLSVFVHGAIGCGLILIPLFQTQLLPQVAIFEPLLPPVATVRTVHLMPASGGPPSGERPNVVQERVMIDPIPVKEIARVEEDGQLSVVGLRPSIGDGGGGGPSGPSIGGPDPGWGLGGPSSPPAPPRVVAAPPPPPAPPAPEAPAVPVRVSSGVIQSNLIKMVQPVYPRLAAQIRLRGVVLLEAIITKEGTISNLRVISGHALLNDAAMDAVKQWRYRPTLLNGVPVEVITTVTVNFSLN